MTSFLLSMCLETKKWPIRKQARLPRIRACQAGLYVPLLSVILQLPAFYFKISELGPWSTIHVASHLLNERNWKDILGRHCIPVFFRHRNNSLCFLLKKQNLFHILPAVETKVTVSYSIFFCNPNNRLCCPSSSNIVTTALFSIFLHL